MRQNPFEIEIRFERFWKEICTVQYVYEGRKIERINRKETHLSIPCLFLAFFGDPQVLHLVSQS